MIDSILYFNLFYLIKLPKLNTNIIKGLSHNVREDLKLFPKYYTLYGDLSEKMVNFTRI